LSGATSDQHLYFLYGKGRNGKSVFINVLTALFGTYAKTVDPSTLMETKRSGGSASGDIARLDGCRFLSSNEIQGNGFFNEELLKRLTGGDQITARSIYKSDFQFTPQFKLFMCGNNLAVIKGRDEGIWRRIALIPFCAHIETPDPYLESKLKGELSGILNWALEGWKMFQSDGEKLTMPAVVINASTEYRVDMDILGRFFFEYLEQCLTWKGLSLE